MAGRDINIPFGPDKSGELNLASLIPEVEPAVVADEHEADEHEADEAVEPATNAASGEDDVLPDSAFEAASEQAYATSAADSGFVLSEPVDDAAIEAEVLEVEPAEQSRVADELEASVVDQAARSGVDVQASLVALKASIDQGRQLKARQKEREEFSAKLDVDREELADREDILANYQVLVAEQDQIVSQNTLQRDAIKERLSRLVAEQDETTETLARMRDYNDSQLQPYETALGRAKAAAEQAKNDERSRKSELTAAETEKRRAEGGDDEAMAAARLETVQLAYDEAQARSESAKEALAQAQKSYDDLREQINQAESPLERSLEDLGKQIDELKEEANDLSETISAARKRRQYCDTVYQYPDETAKLRQSVAADEETVRRMDEENDELRELLAESKQRSKVAKLAIAGVVLLLIVIIVAFVAIGGR